MKIAAKITGKLLKLTVSDQGEGIPEKIRSKIFKPFFTTRKGLTTAGLGLGLSVSRNIIEAIGGSLDFKSKTGQGAVFSIVIPLSKVKKGA